MRPIDLPRTSGFRLGLLFLALFGVASLGMFGFLYIQNKQFQIANIDDWIWRESRAPFAAPVTEVRQDFEHHAQRSAGRLTRVFTLYEADGRWLAGDTLPMPRPVPLLDQPFFFDLSVGRPGSIIAGWRIAMPGARSHCWRRISTKPANLTRPFCSP